MQTVRVELYGSLATDARKPGGEDPLLRELAERIDALTGLLLMFASSFEEVTAEARINSRAKVRAQLGQMPKLTPEGD